MSLNLAELNTRYDRATGLPRRLCAWADCPNVARPYAYFCASCEAKQPAPPPEEAWRYDNAEEVAPEDERTWPLWLYVGIMAVLMLGAAIATVGVAYLLAAWAMWRGAGI